MLTINVPPIECFNEQTQEFVNVGGATLNLEHSLVSISKWESIWKRPFLSDNEMNQEEFKSYVRCMTINKNVNPNVYNCLTRPIIRKIQQYMNQSMTATTFSNQKKGQSRDVVTSELIYYWMITFNIPMECERWHISRLMTLINVCDLKNAPPDKMSKRAVMNQNRQLNAMRRKKLNSKG